MKVKLTGHWGEHTPGDIVEVDETTASNLVLGGALDKVPAPSSAEPDKSGSK